MKMELLEFQDAAVERLRNQCTSAINSYKNEGPQVISFTAPTGSGKTIMASALIESILYGSAKFPASPDSIIVWLSDSPELNEQSRKKIEKYADKIHYGQCVTIVDESFDMEMLEDGHIYFLNTQKIGKDKNLTKHSDLRQFTVWETFQNTIEEKNDRLYFIIDEAHRGAQGNDAKQSLPIMQKFIRGSKDDKMQPMPVVIGMTATPERFDKLVYGTDSTIKKTNVLPEDVRKSGLLKEKIIISYPEGQTGNKEMAVLQAATDDWKDKCEHWAQYCNDVKPVFLVQVEKGKTGSVFEAYLNDCIKKIEERVGYTFKEGEVVNAFGEHTNLPINGFVVRYEEPSRIAENDDIKVVFFKDSLSTGWDCPRAETMMSFCTVRDATYIAQLLGRMVRTPLQRHIAEDETLNDVHLFLPNYDAETVKKVVQALQESEGGRTTEVEEEAVGSRKYEVLSVIPRKVSKPMVHHVSYDQPSMISAPQQQSHLNTKLEKELKESEQNEDSKAITETIEKTEPAEPIVNEQVEAEEQFSDGINRQDIMNWINGLGLKTYKINVKPVKKYFQALCKLIRLMNESGLNTKALIEVTDEIVERIYSHTEKLKVTNEFKPLVNKLMEFKMQSQVVDVFSKSVDKHTQYDLFSTTTDTDIQRQFQLAENELCGEGFGKAYLRKYYDANSDYPQELDVIIFAKDCLQQLETYADSKYHTFVDEYIRKSAGCEAKFKERFDRIVYSADSVSPHNFELSTTIKYRIPDQDGVLCTDHLFVNDEGNATIKLDSEWERTTLDEERKSPDYVCWIRNQKNADWALSIPYEMDGDKKLLFPDFLIVRKDENGGYLLDILEPHSSQFDDNLPKAQGLADYANDINNLSKLSRIQLIRVDDKAVGKKIVRLDFTLSKIRDEVRTARSSEDLNHIFEKYGE